MHDRRNEEIAEPGYEVRWLQAVVFDLQHLFPVRSNDGAVGWKRCRRPRFLVERHARKLAWWREDEPLVAGDLPWRWVPSLRADRVGEVVITEGFGEFDGVRHLFRVEDGSASGSGVIWGLGVWRFTTPAIPPWVVQVAGLRLFSITERNG